jgi:hypothetical protein
MLGARRGGQHSATSHIEGSSMSLLKELMESQGGALVRQLASQHGLDETQVSGAMAKLLPALSGGLKARAADGGAGLDALLGSLQRGEHRRFAEEPSALAEPETVERGNAILGQLLGTKDTSRALAARVASDTGVDVNAIKRMLPEVAATAMGALSKSSAAAPDLMNSLAGSATADPAQRQQALGGIAGLLDADGDGSVADDLFGLAKRFMR